MNSMKLILIPLFCATIIAATSPNSISEAETRILHRSKRRIEEVSSSAIEYMEQLRNRLSDQNGKPKLSSDSDPTEVWVIEDRGELKHE